MNNLLNLMHKTATVEEVINLVTNTPEVIKTSPGKLLNIGAKVNTEQRIAYVISDPKMDGNIIILAEYLLTMVKEIII